MIKPPISFPVFNVWFSVTQTELEEEGLKSGPSLHHQDLFNKKYQ